MKEDDNRSDPNGCKIPKMEVICFHYIKCLFKLQINEINIENGKLPC